MRTDRPDGSGQARDRLRATWDRIRRRFAALGPGGRLLAIAGALAVVAVLGLVASPDGSTSRVWLYPEHRFTASDAERIARRLVARSIDAQVVGGRIEVPSSLLSRAYAEVEKAGLEPQSLRDLADTPAADNPFLSPSARASNERRMEERRVEMAIQEVDPSLALSALVQIRRDPPRGLERAGEVRVTARLTPERDRPIPDRTIDRIVGVVYSLISDLPPGRLTIVDNRGTLYAFAGDPTIGLRSRMEARRDELCAALLKGLDWIEGVRVAVSIEPGTVEGLDPEPGPLVAEAAVVTVVNEPVEVDVDAGLTVAAPVDVSASPAPPDLVSVLVLVPTSYYTTLANAQADGNTPSASDFQAIARRTEGIIRQVVEQTVPEAERGTVTIDRILTPAPARPTPEATRTGPRDGLSQWWPAGVGAGLLAGAVVLLAAGVRLRASAQPPRRPAAGMARRPHFDVDVAEDAGPSERVRELIRQDASAAAGVLRRWIGEGGHDA